MSTIQSGKNRVLRMSVFMAAFVAHFGLHRSCLVIAPTSMEPDWGWLRVDLAGLMFWELPFISKVYRVQWNPMEVAVERAAGTALAGAGVRGNAVKRTGCRFAVFRIFGRDYPGIGV